MPNEADLNIENWISGSPVIVGRESTSSPTTYMTITVREITAEIKQPYGYIQEFKKISEETGSYVQILKEYSFCPVLLGNDNNPVFLYRVIEIIDEIIDYRRLKSEFSNLSFAHFNGAISFLKKLSQLNLIFLDIDELEEIELLDNEKLLNEFRTAFSNEEGTRVLNIGEFYSRSTTE